MRVQSARPRAFQWRLPPTPSILVVAAVLGTVFISVLAYSSIYSRKHVIIRVEKPSSSKSAPIVEGESEHGSSNVQVAEAGVDRRRDNVKPQSGGTVSEASAQQSTGRSSPASPLPTPPAQASEGVQKARQETKEADVASSRRQALVGANKAQSGQPSQFAGTAAPATTAETTETVEAAKTANVAGSGDRNDVDAVEVARMAGEEDSSHADPSFVRDDEATNGSVPDSDEEAIEGGSTEARRGGSVSASALSKVGDGTAKAAEENAGPAVVREEIEREREVPLNSGESEADTTESLAPATDTGEGVSTSRKNEDRQQSSRDQTAGVNTALSTGLSQLPAPATGKKRGVRLPTTALSDGREALHVVATTFCIGMEDLATAVEARLLLLRTFAGASILHQSEQDFLWLVIADPDLDNDVKVELENYVFQRNDSIVCYGRNPRSFLALPGIVACANAAASVPIVADDVAVDVVITTRLDSDDAIHHLTVAKTREAAVPMDGSLKLTLTSVKGYTWHPVLSVDPRPSLTSSVETSEPWREEGSSLGLLRDSDRTELDSIAIGISLIAERDVAAHTSVFAVSHKKLKQYVIKGAGQSLAKTADIQYKQCRQHCLSRLNAVGRLWIYVRTEAALSDAEKSKVALGIYLPSVNRLATNAALLGDLRTKFGIDPMAVFVCQRELKRMGSSLTSEMQRLRKRTVPLQKVNKERERNEKLKAFDQHQQERIRQGQYYGFDGWPAKKKDSSSD